MPAKNAAKAAYATGPYVKTPLGTIAEGKLAMNVGKNETIFSQGDPADAIYFVQTGTVKVSVVSFSGKEAVLAMPGPQEFFGEESLGGQSLRVNTATTLEPATLFQVEKRAMLRALYSQPDLSEMFMGSLLKRSLDLERDVCNHLFNNCEQRLARVLLKLALPREYEGLPDATIRKLSHETLAEMVGTTRSRITHFMNKFRKMGLIEYNGHRRSDGSALIVRTKRLSAAVLQESQPPNHEQQPETEQANGNNTSDQENRVHFRRLGTDAGPHHASRLRPLRSNRQGFGQGS